MGLFVDKSPSGDLSSVVEQAIAVQPQDPPDPSVLSEYVGKVKRATSQTNTFHWSRIIVGIVIAVVLIGAGALLAIYEQDWLAQQAALAAKDPKYVVPTSVLNTIATSLITLGGAWSAALAATLLSEAK
jgi:hypothetical protein